MDDAAKYAAAFSAAQYSREYDTSGVLLPSAGGRVGPEKRRRLSPSVSVYIDPYGSHRFVEERDGTPIGALQVMAAKGVVPVATTAFVLPEHRRTGVASRLNEAARSLFPDLTYSDDRSADGAAWVESVQKPRE